MPRNRCRCHIHIHIHIHMHMYIWYVLRFARRPDPATQRLNGRLQAAVASWITCVLVRRCPLLVGSTRPQSGTTRHSALALSVGVASYKSSRAKICVFNRARQLSQWVGEMCWATCCTALQAYTISREIAEIRLWFSDFFSPISPILPMVLE